MRSLAVVALAVGVAAPAAALVACGGAPPPTMQGRAGMLSQTAVAQKCDEAARGHDRPFVVEWDATDLASFETKAARDTVVVKYQGCTLDVLYGCSDAVAGSFGTYGQPHLTSGGVQGFDIANDGDLYAKLPLGAASLAGRVEAGEQLHLKYFVSGVSTSSRDALYGDDLAKIPGCAGATHFVWAYNLGAFELRTKEASSGSGSGGFAGAGAGGDSSHRAESLAQGGDIATCSTNDQRACRVPIRLALRNITAGSSPANTLAPGVATTAASTIGPDGMATYAATPAGQASQALRDARAKLQAGDGAGCLALMERAAGLDVAQADSSGFRFDHARCEMLAGKCDDGTREARAEYASRDTNHVASDTELDRQAVDEANRNCPSSTAKADNDFVLRAAREMDQAAKANDGDRCQQLFEAIDARLAGAKKLDADARTAGSPRSRYSTNQGQTALERGAYCVAAARGCDAGYPYYLRQYRERLSGSTMADKVAPGAWKTLRDQGRLVCK